MTQAEYRMLLEAAHGLRIQAHLLDADGRFDEAIAATHHADAVGPVVDPTLYREAADRMGQDREVLRAARDLARLGQAVAAGDIS